MAKVHITLQGKGGVGKSLVASLTAQHRKEHNIPMLCIDTDPVNATFTKYKAFSVQRIELLKNGKIDEAVFDQLMDTIVENQDKEIIIDNGASSFIPLSNYLIENQAIELLQEMGCQTIIHPVITGSQSLTDTLNGFDAIANDFPGTTEIIVWLNQYFGEIEEKGKKFEEMAVYRKHKDRINGIITIHTWGDLFKQDMKKMLEAHQTFDEAGKSSDIGMMNRRRLSMMRDDLFAQMDLVIGVPAGRKEKTDGE